MEARRQREVPQTSDGCSVPWLLRYLVPLEVFAQQRACRDHDSDYRLGGTKADRLESDSRLFYALIRGGMKKWHAWLYYLAVRICGSPHWRLNSNRWGYEGSPLKARRYRYTGGDITLNDLLIVFGCCLTIAAIMWLTGCGLKAPTIVWKPQVVKVPVAQAPVVPEILKTPVVTPAMMPTFVEPGAPGTVAGLTADGVLRLRLLLWSLRSRITEWQAWAAAQRESAQ